MANKIGELNGAALYEAATQNKQNPYYLADVQKQIKDKIAAQNFNPVKSVPNSSSTPIKITPSSTNIRRGVRTTNYGPTGNNMANGKPPSEGYVATTYTTDPKTGKWKNDDFKMGSKVAITGDSMPFRTVGDRVATSTRAKFGPTIDIFHNTSTPVLRKYGAPKKDITILK